MKNLRHVLLVIVATSGIMGCASRAPIYNVEGHPMPLEAINLSNQEIGRRICQTVSKRDWGCHQSSPDTLVCHIERRTHKAMVQIDYDQYYFSIHYLDTCNLKYEEGMVHQKYNKWIKLMEKDIIRAVSQE